MITVNERIDLLDRLGKYLMSDNEQWETAKVFAQNTNGWFTQESIELATKNIADNFLKKDLLEEWFKSYNLPKSPKTVGIVMAGNIPMVGFHDFLCGFIMGHHLNIKLSSKDAVLIKHIIEKLQEWSPNLKNELNISEQLKGCDAYIATGSNNSSRYFEQYFSKYPNIIRKNRTSVAILDGAETDEDIKSLGFDIFSYFGLGCRNVTKLYLPEGYDPTILLDKLDIYKDVILHHKYKNNYDYYLAIYLLNKVPYLTNDSLLMVENKEPFSHISVLHYEFYTDKQIVIENLQKDDNIQCVVGEGLTPFGLSQFPKLHEYADGVDTMVFLKEL